MEVLSAAGNDALVVFVDRAQCPWLWPLKRGFRHCFVALRDDPGWLVCDPLKDRIVLARLELAPGMDLGAHYAAQGHRVLTGRTCDAPDRGQVALALLTCVAVVKRLLGVRTPLVLTPWQLFRHLTRQAPAPFRPVPASAGDFALDGTG